MSFSISSPSTTWYPASGYRDYDGGKLINVGIYGYYWSASPDSNFAYYLRFNDGGYVRLSYDIDRSKGQAVRCVKE